MSNLTDEDNLTGEYILTDEDINVWNILNHLPLNYSNGFLAFSVFIIIYMVEYISHVNTLQFGVTSVIPYIHTSSKTYKLKKKK